MEKPENVDYILDQTRDFITLIDREYRYQMANRAYCDAIGKERSEIVGKLVPEVWGDSVFEDKIKDCLERCYAGETIQYVEQFQFGPMLRHMHVTFIPYLDANESISHALVISHDITHITEVESKLTRYEYYDPLTGLFNRRSLNVVLDKEIFKTERGHDNRSHGVLFLKIRDLGRLNETYGTDIADLLLENTAVRIKQEVRNSDYVFRFEGSSFTVFLTNIVRSTDIAIVAEKIHEAVTIPYEFRGIAVTLEAAIGIALYPNDGNSSGDLIRSANSALQQAIREGVEYRIFDRGLHEAALHRLALKTSLQHAFEADELELYFQPFVTLDGDIIGAEALIRWNHPTRGLLAPVDFIDIAEETGLISHIDKWALFSACRTLADWVKNFDIFVSVNVCARDLPDGRLLEIVTQAIKGTDGIKPRHLKIELTERISMVDPEQSIQTIDDLERSGVEVWIDDFGSDMSSLNYLKRLPATRIKIDKTFVSEIHENEKEAEYLATIVNMIRTRGKELVIEGVDSAGQIELLRKFGCDLVQGFHFSPPVKSDEFQAMLEAGRRLPDR